MLVKSMSNIEAANEVREDFKSLQHKVNTYQIHDIKKVMKRNKMCTWDKWYEYTSPRKNKWLYKIDTKAKSHKKIDSFGMTFLCYYYSELGFRVAVPSPRMVGQLMYTSVHFYNGHLFERFIERMGLDDTTKLDAVKHYFSDVQPMAKMRILDKNPDHNGNKRCAGGIPDGMELGYTNEIHDYIVFNTFISNDMLLGDQIEYKEHMDMSDDMVRKLFDKGGFWEAKRVLNDLPATIITVDKI